MKNRSIVKVKDLIKELQKINPELEVMCYLENHNPAHLLIENVSEHEASKRRDEKTGIPGLVFQKSDFSQKIAFIDITSDF